MLSWSFVLERVKEELSLPFQVLERTDEQIVDYFKRNSLKKLGRYFPSVARISLDSSDPELKVPNRQSEYYVVDPEGRTILTIKDLITTFSDDLVMGHPILGAWSYGGVPEYALDSMMANNAKLFSIFDYTFEFIPPNIIRISPTTFSVEQLLNMKES